MTDVTGIGGGVTVSPGGFIMVPFEEGGNASVSSSDQPSDSGSQNGNVVDPQDAGRSLTDIR
jgi:hypothetical protein